MRLTVLVDIIGDNSGEHTVMSVSVQGKDCQGEWHWRIALTLNTQSMFSGSLRVSVGHFMFSADSIF